MQLNLIEKLGFGGFGDVWKAKDQLDRDVAVKIVREANAGIADALAHAKALARATHPNVVAVLTLEQTTDPDTGKLVDCVVMELLQGVTLEDRLKQQKLSVQEVKSMSLGVIDGLAHIHAQGMAHGDLHTENVMVANGTIKVIDILYLDSLARISTERKEARVKRDLVSLRILVQQIIDHSDLGSSEATEFNNMLEADASLEDIRSALLQIVSPASVASSARHLDQAFARVADPDFVEGGAYAAALADETPPSLLVPLFKKLIDEKAYEPKHREYVKAIWTLIPQPGRAEILGHLSNVIDAESPSGRWHPNMRLLSVLGSEGWAGLSRLVQIKLESRIVKDVLAGRKDIHGLRNINGGALGTYALSLWRNFKQPAVLADNLISLLRQNWYTQNYVGEFFMQSMPSIAKATGRRGEFIQALRGAVANDARIVQNKLEELPADWVADVRAPATE